MADATRAVLVRVEGRVQGVSFRAWTQDQARELRLSGWVRNEPDGSVRALLAGPHDAVAAMLARLRQGPPAAKVTGVSVEDADATGLPDGFRITR